ncbi:hypothetical protein SZ55_4057 [Pseudomonas sp. FeS53a]|nr:hypothetical protein SZ55_4057 [Pseudomonas sp. FeS53a]
MEPRQVVIVLMESQAGGGRAGQPNTISAHDLLMRINALED